MLAGIPQHDTFTNMFALMTLYDITDVIVSHDGM